MSHALIAIASAALTFFVITEQPGEVRFGLFIAAFASALAAIAVWTIERGGP